MPTFEWCFFWCLIFWTIMKIISLWWLMRWFSTSIYLYKIINSYGLPLKPLFSCSFAASSKLQSSLCAWLGLPWTANWVERQVLVSVLFWSIFGLYSLLIPMHPKLLFLFIKCIEGKSAVQTLVSLGEGREVRLNRLP